MMGDPNPIHNTKPEKIYQEKRCTRLGAQGVELWVCIGWMRNVSILRTPPGMSVKICFPKKKKHQEPP